MQQYWRAIAFKVSPSWMSFVNTIMSSSLSLDVLLRILSFPLDRSSYTSTSSSNMSLSVLFPNACTCPLNWTPATGELQLWCLPAITLGLEETTQTGWNAADFLIYIHLNMTILNVLKSAFIIGKFRSEFCNCWSTTCLLAVQTLAWREEIISSHRTRCIMSWTGILYSGRVWGHL